MVMLVICFLLFTYVLYRDFRESEDNKIKSLLCALLGALLGVILIVFLTKIIPPGHSN